MNKKFLFASVAFSALFAACSNEAILEEQVVVGQDRPMTNVALSFNEENVSLGLDAETRAYFGQNGGYQWIFEENDKIGGLLMDEWNGEACGIENFTLTDYVHTNYAFKRMTGADGKVMWVTPEQAPVCEGNYFFYFPYNASMNHRGHVAWAINPEQKNYDENGNHWPMQAVKDNQKWLGYKFVGCEMEGKVNKINFDFVPVFAMPTFDIINKAADLTVNKLVVRVTSNRSNDNINLNGTHDLMATTMVLAPASRKFDAVNQIWEEKNFSWHQSQMWYHAQAYTDYGYEESYVHPVADPAVYDSYKEFDASLTDFRWEVGTKPVFPINQDDKNYNMKPTYEYTVKFNNYEVKQMEHIQAMLVMPAGIYANHEGETFEVLLYVTSKANDEYVVRIDLGKPQTQGGTNNSAHDDVNSAAAGKFLKAGQITKFTADFDASAMQSYNITDFKVTSTSDLEWVIKEANDSNNGDNGIYDLNITTTGSRVVLTSDIEKLLNERPNVRLHINGEITIGEGTTENAINLLWFNNPNMKTKLNILNKQVKKVADVVNPDNALSMPYPYLNNCSTITIEEGGELDTKTNKVDIEAAFVINKGILKAQNIEAITVANAGDATADVIEAKVVNAGDADKKATLTATTIEGELDNNAYGEATVETVTEDVDNKGLLNINNAEETISNEGTVNAMGGEIAALDNEGIANIEEATEITDLNNSAELNVNADTKLLGEGFNTEDAVINVAADARLEVMEGILENEEDGIINVYGDLNQQIANYGYVYVYGNGHAVVNGELNANGVAGIIDITNANLETNAEAAKDMDDDNNHNYFRYDIHAETTAEQLDEVLMRKISDHNYNGGEADARIIVRWTAETTTATTFNGVSKSNIDRVIIERNLDFVTVGTGANKKTMTAFDYLNDACYAVGIYNGTNVETPSFIVKEGVTVNVAYEAELRLAESVLDDRIGLTDENECLSVLVNGKFKANNNSFVYGENVKVSGTGYVEIYNNVFQWQNLDIPTANWIGQ